MVKTKISQGATVFVSPDVERTARYYRDVFGCRVVAHYENEEPFAAIYRDRAEIIVVQAKQGDIASNTARYGAGYDVYLAPEDVAGVDTLYDELKQKGATIAVEPHLTTYGCYEFVVEDIDGHLIGIGKIKDEDTFFKGETPK